MVNTPLQTLLTYILLKFCSQTQMLRLLHDCIKYSIDINMNITIVVEWNTEDRF